MADKLSNTIKEINVLSANKIEFVITRLAVDLSRQPDDLDILVKPEDFNKATQVLLNSGFNSSSHDQALGGRIAGIQLNFTKSNCLKIDLHQHFTWRATHYFDLDFVWGSLSSRSISGIKMRVPQEDIDIFLVITNIIFERMYLNEQDYQKIKDGVDKVVNDRLFENQAQKYGWIRSFKSFALWWREKGKTLNNFPKFLPFNLVLYSYFDKLNPVSLAYYLFSYARYLIGKTLPYE